MHAGDWRIVSAGKLLDLIVTYLHVQGYVTNHVMILTPNDECYNCLMFVKCGHEMKRAYSYRTLCESALLSALLRAIIMKRGP